MALHPAMPPSDPSTDGHREVASGQGAIPPDEASLTTVAERLAAVAHELRQAAANPGRVDDVETVAAAMTSALGDLAVGADLAANAVIDVERPRRRSRTGATPSPRARAVAWRLHALGSALRTARDSCADVRNPGRQAPSRAGVDRGR